MPKTDTTGQHHSFEDLMRKYHEGIENTVYAAEVECEQSNKITCDHPDGIRCPFRKERRITTPNLIQPPFGCGLQLVRDTIGPQKIRTDIH